MTQTKIAVIGGSGIYDIDGLEGADWVAVDTPWGAPSDAVLPMKCYPQIIAKLKFGPKETFGVLLAFCS